jgi:hypothetical protein
MSQDIRIRFKNGKVILVTSIHQPVRGAIEVEKALTGKEPDGSKVSCFGLCG